MNSDFIAKVLALATFLALMAAMFASMTTFVLPKFGFWTIFPYTSVGMIVLYIYVRTRAMKEGQPFWG